MIHHPHPIRSYYNQLRTKRLAKRSHRPLFGQRRQQTTHPFNQQHPSLPLPPSDLPSSTFCTHSNTTLKINLLAVRNSQAAGEIGSSSYQKFTSAWPSAPHTVKNSTSPLPPEQNGLAKRRPNPFIIQIPPQQTSKDRLPHPPYHSPSQGILPSLGLNHVP